MSCDLNPSDDQRQICDALAAVLDGALPLARLRTDGRDDLAGLAAFGVFGLTLPAEQGGSGQGPVEEALVHALLGRHAVSTRALASALAARLAAAHGLPDALASALSGGACAGVPAGDRILLIEAGAGDLAVIFHADRIALAVAPPIAATLPGLGGVAALTPVAASALTELCGDAALRRTADLIIAAQLVGIAEAARDLSVAYAKIRRQFGRPIGAFQAVKHHCADMAIAAEAASAQLDMAAVALADGRADAAFQIAALAVLAPRAALANARTCIQIHGGVGFSSEIEAHRFLKQAHALSRLMGGARLAGMAAPLAPLTPARERH